MSEPLITHVLWTFGRAGAERMVLEMARRLPDHGFHCRVISVAGGGEMLKDFREGGIDVAFGPESGSRMASVAFLRQEIRERRPAIWHTHLGADWWGGFAARRERVRPHVVTAHNVDRVLPFSLRVARWWAWRNADRVVCVSDAVRRYAEHDFGVRAERLTVIPNGIALAGRPVRSPRGFGDVPRLLAVGRLVEQKGHAVLLEALAEIRRPWELEIVGVGPLESALRRQAEELGILPRVRFAGSVTDVPARLAQADLFCFPSLWEGQGLALLEAEAAGAPALASNLPVFREAFDEASMAYADAGNAVSWREALTKILTDPIAAERRAERARRIVEERFNVDKMVASYAALYRQLLATSY